MSLTPGLVKKVMTFLEDVLKDSDLLKAGDDGGTDTFGPVKDFHLDRQTVIPGNPRYAIVAVQIDKHTKNPTLSKLKRKGSMKKSTPTVAQILVPILPHTITADQMRQGLRKSMEGLEACEVNTVKMKTDGLYTIEYHPEYQKPKVPKGSTF